MRERCYDEDGNPEWLAVGPEEPYCGDCHDQGCRSCEPTQMQEFTNRLRWRLHRLRARLERFLHPDRFPDDQPPF